MPPPLGVSQNYVEGGGSWGGIAGQCCPLRVVGRYGGVLAATLSQIAVERVTGDPWWC